jgi:hypothetical protein
MAVRPDTHDSYVSRVRRSGCDTARQQRVHLPGEGRSLVRSPPGDRTSERTGERTLDPDR